MSCREILLPWDSQPQDAVEVNHSLTITVGLKALITPSQSIDVANELFITRLASQSEVISPFGKAFRQSNGGSGAATEAATSPAAAISGTELSAMLFFTPGTLSVARYAGGQGLTTSQYKWFFRNHQTTASIARSVVYNTSSTEYRADSSSGVLVNGTPVVQAFTLSGTSLVQYINGTQDGSVTTSGTLKSSTAGISFGACGNDTVAMAGDYFLMAVWDRALSPIEHAAIAKNPWQLFAPRRIWVPVSAASGPPTLVAIAASNLTASGARLTVT